MQMQNDNEDRDITAHFECKICLVLYMLWTVECIPYNTLKR